MYAASHGGQKYLFQGSTCRWLVCCRGIFFSLSPPSKMTVYSSLYLMFQIQSLFFWFWFWFFCYFLKVLFVFNFFRQFQFDIYYFFQFGPYFFYFQFDIKWQLGLFVKVLLVFNFIHQSKFMVLYFSIWLFWFLFFITRFIKFYLFSILFVNSNL
jgi:hypothetical protein